MSPQTLELLARAFGALGAGPTAEELELVARTRRDSGDQALLEAFYDAADAVLAGEDRQTLEEIYRLASRAGAGPFVAPDLLVAVTNPAAAHHRSLQGAPQ
jgi:hypothetical protein